MKTEENHAADYQQKVPETILAQSDLPVEMDDHALVPEYMPEGDTVINVKSIFAKASDNDGFRVLIEPVWPRKAGHKNAALNVWLRDLAPSPGLNDLYSSNVITWESFVARYHEELDANREYFRDLQAHNHNGGLTLVHGSRNEGRNTAVALKMLLENDPATL